MAIVWFATANHCFVVEAFAKTTEPAHRCCADKNKKERPAGTHDRNSDKACCQLFVKDTKGSTDVAAPAIGLTPILLPVLLFLDNISAASASISKAVPITFGPPGKLKQILFSLTRAPNAPPVTL